MTHFYAFVRVFTVMMVLTSIKTGNAFVTTQTKSFSPLTSTGTGAESLMRYNRQDVSLQASVKKMASTLNAHSKLPQQKNSRVPPPSKTRVQQSSIALEFPRTRRFPYFNGGSVFNNNNNGAVILLPPRQRRLSSRPENILKGSKTKKQDCQAEKTGAITKMDAALFATYFCNMMVINLSVVTVPALAAEHITNPHAIAAFIASGAAMAPLGGAFGKIVNGFVCQRLGANRSSWMYLMGLSALTLALSSTRSLTPVGLILIGFEFLSSIQWTSLSSVLQQHYGTKPELMAKGISILSLSSTCGALAAKTIGAGLLQATNWRTVTQIGAIIALCGSLAMKTGVTDLSREQARNAKVVASPKETKSPMDSLKAVLGNKLFWMVGIAHAAGMVAKGTDRFLGPFIQDVSGLPANICAVLTSSVTLGMLIGLAKGKRFVSLDSVAQKMKMLKGNYRLAIGSTIGLGVCGVSQVRNILGNPIGMAGIVTILAGMLASATAFQFYQIPNLVSSTSFESNDAPVALSLIDAVGFFVTSQLFSGFSKILGNLGWTASWGFFAMFFGLGSALMTNAIRPVLEKVERNTT